VTSNHYFLNREPLKSSRKGNQKGFPVSGFECEQKGGVVLHAARKGQKEPAKGTRGTGFSGRFSAFTIFGVAARTGRRLCTYQRGRPRRVQRAVTDQGSFGQNSTAILEPANGAEKREKIQSSR